MRGLLKLILCVMGSLVACGGGDAAPIQKLPTEKMPFAWWNGPPGSLSVNVKPQGPNSIIIAWPQLWAKGVLYPDWRERAAALIAFNPNAKGFYLIDEPGQYVPPISDKTLDEVAAVFPANKILMLSLSWPESSMGQHVPAQVNLLGVNLYASEKITDPVPYLSKLATYGRPMFINLDATAYPVDDCNNVPEERQRQSIALNEAMIAWGANQDIRAYVAFVWEGDPAQRLCGATTMPLIRAYMSNLFKG